MNTRPLNPRPHRHADAMGVSVPESQCIICRAKRAPDMRQPSSRKRSSVPAITERQVAFIESLCDQVTEAQQKLGTVPEPGDLSTRIRQQLSGLSQKEASTAIDGLKELLAALRKEYANRPKSAQQAGSEIEAGYYVLGDQVYKVQRAVHGSGRMYCKRLVVDPDTGRGRFLYDAKETRGVMSQLGPNHVLNKESAAKLGALYGVCVRCGAPLTEDDSIERMMGPVCYAKTG